MPNPLFCNTCKATYEDQTLVFCLNDGTRLVPLGNNAEQTVQMTGQTNPVRPNFPNSEPTIQANSVPPPVKRSGTGLIIAVLVIGFLGLVAVIGAVGAYFMLSDNSSAIAVNSPTPVSSPRQENSANVNGFDKTDALTKELEEKLNKLEKQIEAQKRNNQPISSSNQTQTSNQSAVPTAKVNSPNDGFLALRSLPNTETGTQLTKIPHGATVVLNNCEKNTIKVGRRNGRWCDVEYAGKSGWVFSAWLDY